MAIPRGVMVEVNNGEIDNRGDFPIRQYRKQENTKLSNYNYLHLFTNKTDYFDKVKTDKVAYFESRKITRTNELWSPDVIREANAQIIVIHEDTDERKDFAYAADFIDHCIECKRFTSLFKCSQDIWCCLDCLLRDRDDFRYKMYDRFQLEEDITEIINQRMGIPDHL